MSNLHILGVDLAQRTFAVCDVDNQGHVLFRKKLSRAQFAKFIVAQPISTFAMEACSSAHHWGREAMSIGHTVLLIPPAYMKPFVKRHENDAIDAAAIAEAAVRPSMTFVVVKD